VIIDFHTHIGDFSRNRNDPHEEVTYENLVARLDDEGIDKAVLLPIYASPDALYPGFVLNPGIAIGDQIVGAAPYADRIIPFGNLDPRWAGNHYRGDFSPYLDWFAEHGCKGIGEITANIPFDDLRVVNMVQQIGARGWCVVFHGTGMDRGTYGLQDDPGSPRLERLLREAPDTILVGHGPGFWAEISADVSPANKNGYPKGQIREEGSLPRLLRQYDNLYADMSAGSGYNALTRDPEYGVRFLNEFQDRILFATDVCDARPEGRMPHLKWLKGLLTEGKISQEVFDKISWRNAVKLIGPV